MVFCVEGFSLRQCRSARIVSCYVGARFKVQSAWARFKSSKFKALRRGSKFKQAVGDDEGDGAGSGIDIGDEVVAGGQQHASAVGREDLKEGVDGGVVHGHDGADGRGGGAATGFGGGVCRGFGGASARGGGDGGVCRSDGGGVCGGDGGGGGGGGGWGRGWGGGGIDDAEANDLCPGEFAIVVVGYLAAQEVDVGACELSGLLLRADVAEGYERRRVAAEAVLLHEERHEDAVDFEDEVFRVGAVEDVVGEVECHLALHAVRLADAADLENVVRLDHSFFDRSYRGYRCYRSYRCYRCYRCYRGYRAIGAMVILVVDAGYVGAEGVEALLDVLVAAVDLCDVGDAAGAVGREGSDEQGDAGADVGAGHTACAQPDLAVVAYDDGTVRVAEDDLCAHVDELVDEEQAAFEHLLVEEHGATGLRGHDEQHGEQVGREAWPGSVGEGHDGAVDERLHGVVRLSRDDEVVAVGLDLDAQSAEGVGDDAEVLRRHVLDGDAVADHCSHADERAHLDHVGQDAVAGAVQRGHANDGEQVGGDARDLCSHGVEQVAELLDVGFAGGVVDGCGALGHDGSHDDVGRARDRCLVEQHVGALEPSGLNVEDVASLLAHELCPELLEAQEVGVQPAPSDLVAAGFCDDGLAEAAQQRAYGEHGAAQRGALAHELVALQVVEVEVVGLEGVVVAAVSGYADAHVLEQLDEVVDVEDVGDVLDVHLVAGEQRGTDHLQSLVLGALWGDGAAERSAAFYDE